MASTRPKYASEENIHEIPPGRVDLLQTTHQPIRACVCVCLKRWLSCFSDWQGGVLCLDSVRLVLYRSKLRTAACGSGNLKMGQGDERKALHVAQAIQLSRTNPYFVACYGRLRTDSVRSGTTDGSTNPGHAPRPTER